MSISSESASSSFAQSRAKFIQRRWAVRKIVRTGRVGISDIQGLDRTGRFTIAQSHWPICDDVARHALMNDAHHFVRSAAQISARGRRHV